MDKNKRNRIIAAAFIIIFFFVMTGTCAQASVLETRNCVCSSMRVKTYFRIKYYSKSNSVKMKEGGRGVKLIIDCSKNLKGKRVTWSTSNDKVVTVSNGYLNAVGKGTANITAKTGRYSYTIKVVVRR